MLNSVHGHGGAFFLSGAHKVTAGLAFMTGKKIASAAPVFDDLAAFRAIDPVGPSTPGTSLMILRIAAGRLLKPFVRCGLVLGHSVYRFQEAKKNLSLSKQNLSTFFRIRRPTRFRNRQVNGALLLETWAEARRCRTGTPNRCRYHPTTEHVALPKPGELPRQKYGAPGNGH
jgi:hypothetical protein